MLRLVGLCMLLLSAHATAQNPLTERRIAFTFDDIPRGDGPFFTGQERATNLISALEAAGVEGAMMFVQTGAIEQRSDGAQTLRMYQHAGHILASHSHSHPWLSEIGADAFLLDVDEDEQYLRDLFLENGLLPAE